MAESDDFGATLIALCRCFGLFERDAVCCGDVTTPQCVALQALLSSPMDVSTLASTLGVTVSASTRLIDGLGRRGWVERRRDPEDGRRVLVHLNEEGADKARSLRALSDAMIAGILGRVPEDRRAQVVDSLRLVREALEACQSDAERGGCGAPVCCAPDPS